MTSTSDSASELAWLCRALKAPSLAAGIDRLANKAREESPDPRTVPGRLPRT